MALHSFTFILIQVILFFINKIDHCSMALIQVTINL